ncbi:MAG: glycosyltransferase family 4 protein [bacterium]
MQKRALIVSPYLGHLGGGERYMLTLSSVLESLDYSTFYAWDNKEEILSLALMLGIKLESPQLVPSIKSLYFSHNPLKMYFATKPYDVVVYLSDGSLPLLGGKKNLVHMQVPFHGVNGLSWKNQLKKLLINHVIVNSRFTKRIVDQEFGIHSTVIYPPVSSIEPKEKEKIILSVGRFEPSLNAKKQDVLIKAFRELSPSIPGWKLVLVGASSSEDWISKLKKMATGLPIEFVLNATHEHLSELYAKAKIYWHAAGYEIDEQKNPELTEHFGISTVEAISAGCLPLAVPVGGQKEILTDSQLHWTTIQELVSKTIKVITSPPSISLDVSSYSVNNFTEQLIKLL